MHVRFTEIGEKFDRVFRYIRRDLQRILSHAEPSVNFAAALLITCVCDTLAEYPYGRRGQGERVFKDLLPPEPYRMAGKPLYDALRDGLVHRYDGKDIRYDNQTLRIAIPWGPTKRHLSTIDMEGDPDLVLSPHELYEELLLEADKHLNLLKMIPMRDRNFWINIMIIIYKLQVLIKNVRYRKLSILRRTLSLNHSRKMFVLSKINNTIRRRPMPHHAWTSSLLTTWKPA